jgi:hypothetical protein
MKEEMTDGVMIRDTAMVGEVIMIQGTVVMGEVIMVQDMVVMRERITILEIATIHIIVIHDQTIMLRVVTGVKARAGDNVTRIKRI